MMVEDENVLKKYLTIAYAIHTHGVSRNQNPFFTEKGDDVSCLAATAQGSWSLRFLFDPA